VRHEAAEVAGDAARVFAETAAAGFVVHHPHPAHRTLRRSFHGGSMKRFFAVGQHSAKGSRHRHSHG